jgi:hypothetical protein
MSIEELVGQFVNVVVGKDGKVSSKVLKVCKANTRSVLFIEVDKENRKNIFRKISVNDIAFRGIVDSPHVKPELTSIFLKEGVLPTKWESEWDSIGKHSPVTTHYIKHYNNRSNGWAHRLKSNSQYNYGGGAHFRT